MISRQLSSSRAEARSQRDQVNQVRSQWPHAILDTPILEQTCLEQTCLEQTCLEQTWHSAIASALPIVDLQPQFHLNQRVYFVGGCGTVKHCQSYAQTWTYAVEMELGPEPEMGRIGGEATILLNESEIHGLVDAAS